ncbi:hypothetical protein [Kitasatospora kifunensis]|uniref:Lipoprotein n=1 Tax=Kitasatospora kifunensis TaxID=58351 RepID=A0A7W7VYG8_KITKI|nr:hypothetical protein [Kitasatospora kifunensis]MBB4927672.1 hypothetical protein [Kitasatospora kifunensis]
MRINAIAACSATALCGALALTPAVASACVTAGSTPGVAKVAVQTRTAHPGQTVSILGSCAKRPGAVLKSVTSNAGNVQITDRNPQHIRGTLRIAFGPSDYHVVLVCNNSQAGTLLPVTAAPAPAAASKPAQQQQHHCQASQFAVPYGVRGWHCGR